MKPKQLTTALGTFVKDNREEELGAYQSLYVEIWRQWRALDDYSMDWADELSRELARKYWQGMNQWYQHFDQLRDQIMDLTLAPPLEVTDFYIGVVNQYAKDVQEKLPVVDCQQPVVKINDFVFRLRQQLTELAKLDTGVLTMIDIQLLIEYWHALAKVAGVKIDE